MITVPAFVWRGGSLYRGVALGLPVGLFLSALAWIDSGMLLGGVISFVITGLVYGVWMPRRMARYWPGGARLSGDERVTVVRTARRGERIRDPRLARSVIDYSHGLHAAAEQGRPFRWFVPVVLVVGIGTAVWDSVFGSWGNMVASFIYLVLLLIELFWWPKRRDELLANTDRAADIAQHIRSDRS